MPASGVYWIGLYPILEEHGLEVRVTNARYTQRLPGRKSDVQECQGLQKLHPFGLLPRSGIWRTEWLFVVQQNLYR